MMKAKWNILILFQLNLLVAFAFQSSAQPQSWKKVYPLNAQSRGVAVKEIDNGRFIIGAELTSISSLPNRMLLFKINAQGDSITSRVLCGSVTGDIELNNNKDEVVIIGTASSCIPNIQSDIVYYRLDTLFNTIDTAVYGNSGLDKGKRIINDYDSGFVMACYNTSYPDLIHIDKHGSQIWSMNYGLSGLTSIKRNLEGGYFICGNAGGGFVDPLYVAKIDSIGNVIWYKTFYSTGWEGFTDIEPTPDSGVVALTDYFMLYKISATGDSSWMKNVYPGFSRMKSTTDGNLILTGGGAALVKADTSGQILWTSYNQIYPGSSSIAYEGWDVIETSDGGFLLVGEIDSLGTKNLYVVKTDSIGQVTTGLNNYEPNFSAFCYPQPFREQTTITLSNHQNTGAPNNWVLSVYNMQGILLREEPVSGFPYIFKRNNLISGIYLYTITQSGKIPITGKMVVE
jgi:hypothetical protein